MDDTKIIDETLLIESAVAVIEDVVIEFLNLKNLFLVDELDEVTYLLRDRFSGKIQSDFETILKRAILQRDDVARIAYEFIVGSLTEKSISIENVEKVKFFFNLKEAVPRMNKYLEKKVAC